MDARLEPQLYQVVHKVADKKLLWDKMLANLSRQEEEGGVQILNFKYFGDL